MPASPYWRICLWRVRLGAACGVLLAAALLGVALATADQPADDDVGVIEGENLAISGPMRVELVAGQSKTILRSGSDVRVNSGQARISLVEGGQVSICGPAHLSVLKAGGSLTIALDRGVIHVRVDEKPALVIYTPQIEATPVAIAGEPRDLLVGFDASGEMCVRPYRGALRLEQQLTSQNLVVPQGGDVLITNGQLDALRTGDGHCACELQTLQAMPIASPTPPVIAKEASPAAPAEGGQLTPGAAAEEPAPTEPPAANDAPILHVDLPPLVFDAKAKVQPEPDPRLMVVVRRVRVRSALVFQGRVEDAPATTATVAPRPQPTLKPSAKPAPPPSTMDRLRSFFHGLWSRSDSSTH